MFPRRGPFDWLQDRDPQGSDCNAKHVLAFEERGTETGNGTEVKEIEATTTNFKYVSKFYQLKSPKTTHF